MEPKSRELARKTLHMAMGGFAFVLHWLNFWQAGLCALAALLNNLFILPRVGGRKVFRGEAAQRGHDPGIVIYPASVLALVLLFPHTLHIAAAAWTFMAFGDGLATVFGVAFGSLTGPLPWNRSKSWAGWLGFLIGGIPMAIAAFGFVGKMPLVIPLMVMIAIVGLILAVIESLPLGIDDNLVIPLAAGGLLFAGTLIDHQALLGSRELLLARLPWAIGINLPIALLAFFGKSVDLSGLIHGVLLGVGVFTFGGPQSFAILCLFFVLGTAATKVGFRTKAREGTAQEKGGRRGARHAWANTGVALLFAFLGVVTPHTWLCQLALVAALATATADTLGSEIGQAFGRRTFLVTTLQKVPRGTDGAISVEGTLAGILGAALIGAAAYGLKLIDLKGIGFVTAAACLGSLLESYTGALLERAKLIDNEAQNFLNTLAGALLALGLVRWIG